MTNVNAEYQRYNEQVEENVKDYVPFFSFLAHGIDAYNNMYESVEVGDTININPNYIKYHTSNEFEMAGDGAGITEGAIEIAKIDGYFVCQDGHHRLYEAMKRGDNNIKAKVVADNYTFNAFLYREERF